MNKWNELKQLAESAMPKCCGEAIPTGVEYGGQREMMCCDAWQSDGEVVVNPFDLLSLIQENERLREERDSQQRVAIKALEEVSKLNGTLDAICATLPMAYLGPANGGMQALAGDFARMAKDADRYRWLRASAYGAMQDYEMHDLFSYNDSIIDEKVDEMRGGG